MVVAPARKLVFITGSSKRAIEDHFDTDHELEEALEAQGKKELLKALKDEPIILVCRTDKRSANAATILRDAGFRDVRVLRGGITPTSTGARSGTPAATTGAYHSAKRSTS